MINSCYLSRAQIAAGLAAALAASAFFDIVLLAGPSSRALTATMLAAAVVLLGFSWWSIRRAAIGIAEVARVAAGAARGDLDVRIASERQPGVIGTAQKSVDDMLDIVDAFVREASASMDYASRGKYFRKIMVRGMPGSFRRAAATINRGTDSLGSRVVEVGSMAQTFGSHLDEIAGNLVNAAANLETDATKMAASAEVIRPQVSSRRRNGLPPMSRR